MPTSPRTFSAPSRRGTQSVVSSLTLDEALTVLRERLSHSSFARDLVAADRSNVRYGLSERQEAWVHILAVRALEPQHGSIKLPAIAALLRTARAAGAKVPRLSYPAGSATPTGELRVATAGHQSAHPGRIHVSAGAYGTAYYGILDPETGDLITPGTRQPLPAEVRELLLAIDAHPVEFSRLAGWLTSSCCYCGRELSTAESRGAGYGPVCAERYGLPWGAETAAKAPSMDDLVRTLRALPGPLQAVLEPSLVAALDPGAGGAAHDTTCDRCGAPARRSELSVEDDGLAVGPCCYA